MTASGLRLRQESVKPAASSWVICGHLIPAGTGLSDYQDIVVTNNAENNADALNEL